MKTSWRVVVLIHVFLTSTLVGDEWSASCPGPFTPGERALVTQWMEGRVGFRADMDDVEK
jgi:hypothetical protein